MMCVGLTVTYLTTKVPNFAVGDFVTTGTYATAAAFIIGNVSNSYLATPIGFLLGGIVAVVMYAGVLRPLIRRGSSIVMLMIATLAVDIIFTGGNLLFIEYVSSHYAQIIGSKGYNFYTLYNLPDFQIQGEPGLLIAAPIALILMTLSMYYLLNKTRFGTAMRAAIENANLARTVGINVEKVYFFSWFIAGGLAGFAGGFFAIAFTTQQNEATLLIVTLFAGSVLGGLSSIYGAIIGGLIIGIAELLITGSLVNFASFVLNNPAAGAQINDFQKGIPLGIMILALLFAPQGLIAVRWRRFIPSALRPKIDQLVSRK
jgi:branched-chain amino acid transport system permease protein